MTQPVSIELRQCAKTWGNGAHALHPTDLHIPGGEILSLLGPSGCGKTTLLRMVCGLESPDAGSQILFDGEDVTRLAPQDRGVGVVFQNYALFPNMSVAQNVAYGLKVRGIDAAERDRRVKDMLALVRLSEFSDRRIDQLSGGQRQRVALARALAIKPRVLLLDEPLTALDAKLREHVRVELAQMLQSLGITTLIVTHDQDEAMMLGHRIAVMSAGRMEQVGSAETLYRTPATAFVAQFLGTLCTVRADVRDNLLVDGAGALNVRPHQLDVIPLQPGALQARIVSRFFLGDRVRLELALHGDQPLSITTSSDSPYSAGDTVSLRLNITTPPIRH